MMMSLVRATSVVMAAAGTTLALPAAAPPDKTAAAPTPCGTLSVLCQEDTPPPQPPTQDE
ncbi:hypothetical protein [Actinomadura fibrosa]|uniref:D-alanyl-D-alanine carboxypeptidase n=1 Tax=Actinomadura fibrosa TaxID=111802 RepID=A0ABW2XSR5_9ACTN|nr:hypothetical protein [Actinomadura fibrosa]